MEVLVHQELVDWLAAWETVGGFEMSLLSKSAADLEVERVFFGIIGPFLEVVGLNRC